MSMQIKVNKQGTLSMSPAVLRASNGMENTGFFTWLELSDEKNTSNKFSWRLYISDEAKGTPLKSTYSRVYFSNPRARTGTIAVKRLLLDMARIQTILTGDETQVADFTGSYDVVRVTKAKFYIKISRRKENGKTQQSKQGTEEVAQEAERA